MDRASFCRVVNKGLFDKVALEKRFSHGGKQTR